MMPLMKEPKSLIRSPATLSRDSLTYYSGETTMVISLFASVNDVAVTELLEYCGDENYLKWVSRRLRETDSHIYSYILALPIPVALLPKAQPAFLASLIIFPHYISTALLEAS
jgi:hypothetical protein